MEIDIYNINKMYSPSTGDSSNFIENYNKNENLDEECDISDMD